jgi:hypothetical protein
VRKSVLASAALALITSSVLIGAGPQADASTTCSGLKCDGVPAANTPCVNDAVIIDSEDHYVNGTLVGNLQLKYSPSCRTIWGRVVSYIGDRGDALAINSKGEAGCDIIGGGTGCNSGMMYDAGVQGYAQATLITGVDTQYTWHTISY